MKFEKVMSGEYRAQRGTFYIWVVRRSRKWFWVVGGYSGYPFWAVENGPFPTRKAAIKDAVNNYSF